MINLGFRAEKLEEVGLDFVVEENGDNLSLGEKQMISFMRIAISEKKLIVLDEATAGLDLKTEQKIQEMIDNRFDGKTMFIVAHRIQTVLKCDKILVLDEGNILEFDTIENLLKIEDGRFNAIFKQFKM